MTDPAESDGMDELREAAGAVLISLKQLIDAAERAVADPQTFDRMVNSGRGIVEAFTSGFLDEEQAEGTPDHDDAGA